jgi:hypothetical protein
VMPARSTPADARDWFSALYRGMRPGHYIEQRYFKDDRTRTFSPSIDEAMAHALERKEQSNVYPGMALRGPREKGGGRANCVATNVLWAEYDLKHGAEALDHLRAFGLALSIIVHSGGGFHVQILLDALLDVTTEEMKDRVEAANRHLAYALGGDVTLDNIGDLPRILRAPGTLNRKYTPPRPVELVRLEPDRRYALEEVESWLQRHHPLPERPRRPMSWTSQTQSPAASPRGRTGGRAERHISADGLAPSWEEWLAQAPGWAQTLEQDGWQYAYTRDDAQYWIRPGKDAREGISASLGYAGPDVLHVFTSSVKGLEQNRNYDRWSYEVAMHYDGDYAAAARAKAEQGYGTLGRYAKEHCDGDLRAAAKELGRQKEEAANQRRAEGPCVYQTIDLATGECHEHPGGIVCRRGGGGELRTGRGAQWLP